MLTNLSPSLISFLWSLKDNEKNGKVHFLILSKALTKKNSLFSPYLKSKSLKKKFFSVNSLLDRAYIEAMEDQSYQVETEHLFLALVSFIGRTEYLKAKDFILSKKPRDYPKRKGFSDVISDITLLAELNLLPKVVEREDLLNGLIQKLLLNQRSNIMVLGPKGIGKTSLVYSLAQKVIKWDVPKDLIGTRIIGIDMVAISGAAYDLRSNLEEGMEEAVESHINSGKKVMFFFDNLNMLPIGSSFGFTVKSGKSPIHFIGAAEDTENFRLLDSPLGNLWEPFVITEPKGSVLGEIIKLHVKDLSKYHNIKISDMAVCAAMKRETKKMWSHLAMPGKALAILDGVCAKERISADKLPTSLIKKNKNVLLLKIELRQAIKKRNLDKAYEIDKKVKRLEKSLFDKKFWKKTKLTISKRNVDKFVSGELGSAVKPVVSLTNLEDKLCSRVIGQKDAVYNLVASLRRSFLKLKGSSRPIGSFLFLGATGVGKTETARVLADIVFGGKKNFIRIDMSDFRERHAVSRLVGAPPGYVGYEEGGQLTEFIRENPESVVLFDEVEKAHPDVLNILLQIMEEGELVDASGVKASFKDCIIILTGNIGSDLISKGQIGYDVGIQKAENGSDIRKPQSESHFGLPFSARYSDNRYPSSLSYNTIKERILEEVKKVLKPEFLNRLDDVIVFKLLLINDLLRICDLIVNEYKIGLEEKGIKLLLTRSAKEYLVRKSFSPEFGARPLRRLIEKEVVDGVAVLMLSRQVKKGDTVKVIADKSGIKIGTVPKGTVPF